MDEVRQVRAAGRARHRDLHGFQILLEAGMLPGAVRRNDSLKYVAATSTSRWGTR